MTSPRTIVGVVGDVRRRLRSETGPCYSSRWKPIPPRADPGDHAGGLGASRFPSSSVCPDPPPCLLPLLLSVLTVSNHRRPRTPPDPGDDVGRGNPRCVTHRSVNAHLDRNLVPALLHLAGNIISVQDQVDIVLFDPGSFDYERALDTTSST